MTNPPNPLAARRDELANTAVRQIIKDYVETNKDPIMLTVALSDSLYEMWNACHTEMQSQLISSAENSSRTFKKVLDEFKTRESKLVAALKRTEKVHLASLEAINTHMGYKFTQPLMELRDTITAVLKELGVE